MALESNSSSGPTHSVVPAGPTPSGNRIVVLDILRGFALLGILLVNIMSFSGIGSGSQEWTGYADQAVQDFIQFFARGKFLSLFAILFGIGFAMQIDRLAATANQDHWIVGRRLLVLVMFGALHVILDPAEVLILYAMCGALLFFFRKASPKALLLWALLILPLPYLHTVVVSTLETIEPPAQTLEDTDSDSDVSWNPYVGERAVRVSSAGALSDVMAYNINFSINRWTSSWVTYLWMTVPLPLMLIGFFVGRSKVLERQHDERPKLRWAFWLGLGIGIVGTWFSGVLFARATIAGWEPWIWFAASVLWALAALLMALGYAAGIALLVQHEFWKICLKPLQAVGRFALTNYLLQTLICTTIFYSYGLGLYGKVSPAYAVLLVVAIYLLQVALSSVWSRRFRYGPAEWLWRSVTYGRLQPLRRR